MEWIVSDIVCSLGSTSFILSCLVRYPNITNLAEQVFEVVRHYKLSYLVGLGVGLGANVLARFAVRL